MGLTRLLLLHSVAGFPAANDWLLCGGNGDGSWPVDHGNGALLLVFVGRPATLNQEERSTNPQQNSAGHGQRKGPWEEVTLPAENPFAIEYSRSKDDEWDADEHGWKLGENNLN